jgi:hypothetical protein
VKYKGFRPSHAFCGFVGMAQDFRLRFGIDRALCRGSSGGRQIEANLYVAYDSDDLELS